MNTTLNVTVAEYAKKLGISKDAARHRLTKLVKQGKAQTWIEKTSVLTDVSHDSNLVRKVRYYEISCEGA